MGFWTGMREAQVGRIKNRQRAEEIEIEERRYQERRADEQKAQDVANFTSLRNAVLPLVLDRAGKSREQRAAISSQLASLEAINLPKDVSLALIKSGQAENILKTAEKDGGHLLSSFIQQLTDTVASTYEGADVEERTRIILDGINLVGDDMSDANQQASIFQTLYGAKTQEDLLASLGGLDFTTPTFTAPAMQINYAGMAEIPVGTQTKIDRDSKQRMASVFGPGVKFIPGPEGSSGTIQYEGEIPYTETQSNAIIGAINETIVAAQTQVRDLTGNQNAIYNKVAELVTNKSSYEDILRYLKEGVGIRNGRLVFGNLPPVITNPASGNAITIPKVGATDGWTINIDDQFLLRKNQQGQR